MEHNANPAYLGSRFRIVTVAILCLTALTSPAFSDRHCSPVLDSYFQGRAELKGDGGCPENFARAKQRLEDARDSAADCGCQSLLSELQEFLDELQTDATSCEQSVLQLLALEDMLDREYRKCL